MWRRLVPQLLSSAWRLSLAHDSVLAARDCAPKNRRFQKSQTAQEMQRGVVGFDFTFDLNQNVHARPPTRHTPTTTYRTLATARRRALTARACRCRIGGRFRWLRLRLCFLWPTRHDFLSNVNNQERLQSRVLFHDVDNFDRFFFFFFFAVVAANR
jgi:hypothetical protein